MTRCVKIGGQILEHRRLDAPVGFHRQDCQPHSTDIGHLLDRANRLHHTIILETSERLACIRGKFGVVPGIIFITELGRVVSRDEHEIAIENFVPEPGPVLEFGKLRRVLSLCNLGDVRPDQIEGITVVDFGRYEINDSPYQDEVADIRSF